VNDIGAVSDQAGHAVAVPRRGSYADVRDFLQGSGCPAGVYEVADSAGLTVSYRLKVLQANGHLRSGAGRLFGEWERQAGYHPALHIEAHDVPGEVTLPSRIGAIVLVPVCGWIPAGPLNLANQAFESAFLLDKRPIGEGTFFMLKVVGDSMINAGIADGNWVVVRQREGAKNGEIVAAMVDGEVTVKTFRQEHGLLELVPQNPDPEYQPIPVAELTILGTVVGVVRQA
jgi:repressor LexA